MQFRTCKRCFANIGYHPQWVHGSPYCAEHAAEERARIAAGRRYCPTCGRAWATTATTAVCDGVVVTLIDTPPTPTEETAVTARPVPRAAERNKAALARAEADDYTLEIRDQGMAEAFAVRSDGSRYQMWASAGGYIDGSRPFPLVAFTCQCKGGATAVYGVTPCKHTALLARALFERKAVAVDSDGAYVITEVGLGAASTYTLAELLLPYATA